MNWTCPKCGKKLEISNQQLIKNDGVIVCPQCLLQARQPMPKSQTRSSQDETETPPKRQASPPTRITPPAPKPRMKQASTSYRYAGVNGNNNSGNTTPPKRKTTGKKKSKKKKQSDGMSALGCFGRTIVITLVLFAAYVFFGLLLEALQ